MKRKTMRLIAIFLLINHLFYIIFPLSAFALTGGPSQPEVQSFEPVNTTQMVDLFSGDFVYNIPLLDVGGYPINISYHSGITMDQESSWVGLGWNINPGVINRNMRGLPDDFLADSVRKDFNQKENKTYGINLGPDVETLGFPFGIGLDLGLVYNNYRGIGISLGINPTVHLSKVNGDPKTEDLGVPTFDFGIKFSSQSGVSIEPGIGYYSETNHNQGKATSYQSDSHQKLLSVDINSRTGLGGLSVGSFSGKDPGLNLLAGFVGSHISFASPTYTPTFSLPIANNSYNLAFTVGGEVTGVHIHGKESGFYSRQFLQFHSQVLASYGYLYADEGQKNAKALMDFNREKDIPYKKSTATLPVTNFTYDLFSVNGEGTGGQFRACRGDVGTVFDPQVTNYSEDDGGGVEIGLGNVVHGGGNISSNFSNSISGKWVSDNQLSNLYYKFQGKISDSLYERYYFKNMGEKTIRDTAYYNQFGDTTPARVKLSGSGSYVYAASTLQLKAGATGFTSKNVSAPPVRYKREKRNQVMTFLSGAEAKAVGLDQYIKSYPSNQLTYGNCTSPAAIDTIDRIKYSQHHISEITILNPNGKRYVYGIPAYNTFQKEVTFSVQGGVGNLNTGLVAYDSTQDNTINNNRGRDNYYSATSLPPYAHSFFLSGVLSPDYVDRTNDGITDDDLGEAIKFNYTLVIPDYKWRTPVKAGKATFQEGLRSDSEDDKASYIYGKKEIWYVHSIESKNFVARFYTSNKKDGLGVKSENGGVNFSTTKKLQKLDSIALYSKEELIQKGTLAVPIKTVHFEYDSTLCQNADNSGYANGGKLTLKKMYFTYGKNVKGRLNSYVFEYSIINPSYDQTHYDRWGSYKNNSDASAPIHSISEKDYPYSLQDTSLSNENSSAWSLTKIILPSGGAIDVKYESDDYAFVQNVRAMQMFTLDAVGFDPVYSSSGSNLYGGGNDFYLYLTIPEAVANRQELQKKYMEGVDKIYFKCYVDLANDGDKEYVSGYAIVEDFNVQSTNHVWIKVKPYTEEGSADNPISKAAWQMLRINLPLKAYPYSENNGSAVSAVVSLIGSIFQVANFFTGFDGKAKSHEWGKTIEPAKSWVRLDNPILKKQGGGSRVRSVSISDDWNEMTGEDDFNYGQQYSYAMIDTNYNDSHEISSGVAAYEPLIGGEEIALRNPIFSEEKQALAPNNEYYTETPMGESLYPAPQVGYRQVTVQNLKHSHVKRTATGKMVHEFYTAYDFPVVARMTLIDPHPFKPTLLNALFKFDSKEYMTVSQGYTVECNDMHGKPKSVTTYDELGGEISSETYNYKVDDPSATFKHLQNDNIQVLNDKGTIETATIGKDIDVWQDARESSNQTSGFAFPINGDFFTLAGFPLLIPTIFQSLASSEVRFRSAVTTKYINRFGILDNVVKKENGSSVTTTNVLFDGDTGEPLLTRTTNEFDDPLYSLTIPAHWAYSGMEGAYKNVGAEVKDVVVNGKLSTVLNAASIFSPGDEVIFTNAIKLLKFGANYRFWVIKPKTTLILVDQFGKPYDSGGFAVDLKVVRSGRRNMASFPITSITSKGNPIVSNALTLNASTQIVDCSAQQFKDQWKTNCTNVLTQSCDSVHQKITGCLIEFLKGLCSSDNFYPSPYDGVVVADYLSTECDGAISAFGMSYGAMPFYALTEPLGYHVAAEYSAQFGPAIFSISSNDGSLNKLDSLAVKPFTFADVDGCFPLYSKSCSVCDYSTDPVATACLQYVSCSSSCMDFGVSDTINPYTAGILGNWRPFTSYLYYDKRTPSLAATTVSTQTDGIYNTFYPFFTYSSGIWTADLTHTQWVKKNEVTLYNQKGQELENKDALGHYSAALYGYQESLPVAVASNSQFRQIVCENFEDVDFDNQCSTPCSNNHWNLKDLIVANTIPVIDGVAHTGKRSMKIAHGTSQEVTTSFTSISDSILHANARSYRLQIGGCLEKFNPPGGDYLVSAWVKENANCKIESYVNDSIIVSFTGSAQKYHLNASGPIIDGWQRYESKFSIPSSGVSNIKLKFTAAGSLDAYFDDVRIAPYQGNMKSFVYNPTSLLLMATLDENNYATLYEYDDEGNMIRIKRETEKGIVTLQENRSEYKKGQ